MPHFHSNQKGACHTTSSFFEEIDHVGVTANGNNQFRLFFIGKDEGYIFTRSSERKRYCIQSQRFYSLHTKTSTVRVGMDDYLLAAFETPVADTIHVPNDDVGLVSGIQQCISPSVYAYHHRIYLVNII